MTDDAIDSIAGVTPMREEARTIENSDLTPEQALGVALSTGPMADKTMGEAQAEAIPMMAHLRTMGFTVAALSAPAGLCGCVFDSSEPSGVCPKCHHREHGSSGCRAALSVPAGLDTAALQDALRDPEVQHFLRYGAFGHAAIAIRELLAEVARSGKEPK